MTPARTDPRSGPAGGPGCGPGTGPGTTGGPGCRRLPDRVRARLDAGTYIATSDAVTKLGHGVTADRLRDWLRRRSVDVDIVRYDDGQPCRVRGPRRWENIWIWSQLTAAEEKVRTSGRGRPRKNASTY